MSPNTEQLLSSALKLPESERLELAEAILAASEPPVPELTGEKYLEEIRRRSTEVDSQQAPLASWAEVKSQIRGRAGK